MITWSFACLFALAVLTNEPFPVPSEARELLIRHIVFSALLDARLHMEYRGDYASHFQNIDANGFELDDFSGHCAIAGDLFLHPESYRVELREAYEAWVGKLENTFGGSADRDLPLKIDAADYTVEPLQGSDAI